MVIHVNAHHRLLLTGFHPALHHCIIICTCADGPLITVTKAMWSTVIKPMATLANQHRNRLSLNLNKNIFFKTLLCTLYSSIVHCQIGKIITAAIS